MVTSGRFGEFGSPLRRVARSRTNAGCFTSGGIKSPDVWSARAVFLAEGEDVLPAFLREPWVSSKDVGSSLETNAPPPRLHRVLHHTACWHGIEGFPSTTGRRVARASK